MTVKAPARSSVQQEVEMYKKTSTHLAKHNETLRAENKALKEQQTSLLTLGIVSAVAVGTAAYFIGNPAPLTNLYSNLTAQDGMLMKGVAAVTGLFTAASAGNPSGTGPTTGPAAAPASAP